MQKIIKQLYNIIPFKKQFYYLLKMFWRPPHSVYKHLHFKGLFTIDIEGYNLKLKHHGYHIENEIFWSGLSGWEELSIELWIKLCKRSAVIMDVGANTGIFSLVAKTITIANFSMFLRRRFRRGPGIQKHQ